MKLNFGIVCDNAFIDESGRLSIIQTFDSINSSKFPAIHPRLTIVTSYSGEKDDIEGSKKQVISIKNASGEEKIKLESTFSFNKSKKYNQTIAYVIGMRFEEKDIGMCNIEIELDGKKYDPLTLEIKKLSVINE